MSFVITKAKQSQSGKTIALPSFRKTRIHPSTTSARSITAPSIASFMSDWSVYRMSFTCGTRPSSDRRPRCRWRPGPCRYIHETSALRQESNTPLEAGIGGLLSRPSESQKPLLHEAMEPAGGFVEEQLRVVLLEGLKSPRPPAVEVHAPVTL